jgi:hypothetical protein
MHTADAYRMVLMHVDVFESASERRLRGADGIHARAGMNGNIIYTHTYIYTYTYTYIHIHI